MTSPENSEYHRFLMVIEPGQVGSTGTAPHVVAFQVAAFPVAGRGDRRRRFGYQAAVLVGRELPLLISEPDGPGPRRGWELRTSGLWADHVCETPGRHWSYGLEAFALAVDDPVELLGHGLGQPTPLGWELEFEADGPPRASGPGCEVQAGVGHGLLLGPDGALPVEGPALRGHGLIDGAVADGSTDVGAWLGAALLLPGRPALGAEATPVPPADDVVVEVALPTSTGVWWVARTADGVRTRGW